MCPQARDFYQKLTKVKIQTQIFYLKQLKRKVSFLLIGEKYVLLKGAKDQIKIDARLAKK